MSQRLPVDGVHLVAEGTQKFISDLNSVSKSWNSVAGAFSGGQKGVSSLNSSLQSSGKSAESANSGFLLMAGGAGIAAAGVTALLGTLKKMGATIVGVMGQSLMLAGEFQEMEFTALAVGRAMGLTEETIRSASKEIQDLGIRQDVANKTVAQFARNQIDLAKARDLVNISQATGIIMDADSSQTL